MSKSRFQLLAGTSLATIIMALAAGPAHAVPVGGTVIVNGGDEYVATDPNDDPAILFETNDTAYIDTGVNVTGTGGVAIAVDYDGDGAAVFNGDNVVTGDIGSGDSYLGTLVANDSGSGTFTAGGDVFAYDVYVYGNMGLDGGTPIDGTAEFQGSLMADGVGIEDDGLVLFSGDGAEISTDIYAEDDDYGSVFFAGQDASFTGDIGDEEYYLYSVDVGNDTTFTGNLYAYDLSFSSGLGSGDEPVDVEPSADHTLTLGNETYIASNVYTENDGEGTLDFLGYGYVDGSIGESDYRLNTVQGGTNDGVLEINGNVYAGNVEIVGDSEVTDDPEEGAIVFYGSTLEADQINFQNDGLLVIDQGAYIEADITTDNAGQGNLLLLGGSDVDGDVGTGEAPIATVTLASNATFYGDVNASEVALADYGDGSDYSLQVQGDLNADVTTDNNGDGRVYLYNNAAHQQIGDDETWLDEVRYEGGMLATLDPEYAHVMGGDVYAYLTRLQSDVTLDLGGGDRLISGDFIQSGILSLGENALMVGGMLGGYDDLEPDRLREDRIINTTVSGETATDLGRVEADGDINMDNVTVNVTLPDGINPRGVSYEFLTSWYGEVLNIETALVQGGAVWTWSLSLNDEANIAFLEATRDSGGYRENADGLDDGGDGAAGVLDDIVDSGDDVSDDLDDLLGDLDNLDGDDLGDALNDLSPNENGGVQDAVNDAVNGAKGRIGGRLGGRRGGGTGGGGTDVAMNGTGGISAGDMATERNAWIALSGDHARQGFRNSQSGFEVGSVGVAMGADKVLANDGILGAALAVADADVKHKDTRAGDKTGVRSYQVYGYGSTRKGAWKIDGMAGLGLHQIENRRNTITGTAHGDYDALQLALQVAAGYDVPVGRNATFTPVISADYLHLAEDGYTETGAGGANLTVDDNNLDQFTTGLGARIGWDYKPRVGMHVSPELHAMVTYDWTNVRAESTARFTGGGATFTTQGGKPDRTSLNLGGSVDMLVSDQTTVSLSYDADLKDKYVGQSGMVKAKFRF